MASDYTREQILDIVERQVQASGIPREDFLRFAYIETGGRFNPGASNPSGAKGLFQFMPGTAAQYGIAGREFDPVENTRAAADLYRDNLADITRRHARSGHAFLSGQEAPSGLDLYVAHQQGAAGYASIQNAIANGEFTRTDTRRNILNNISPRDVEALTGHAPADLRGLGDRELADAFSRYWVGKYAAIEIPERGIHAAQAGPARERAAPLADGVLERGEGGDDVRALQASLNQLGFRDGQGAELETRSGVYGPKTAEAVRAFQTANSLEATGAADPRTRDAIVQQLALPEQERNRPRQPAEARGTEGGLVWPTPGNRQINQADKPREGHGEFRTPRSGGRRHGGIDIQGEVGDPVVAVAGGTVVVRPNNGAAGNTVHVRHDDGTLTKYFHLDQFSVRDGQRVEAGQQVGTMGRTGNTPSQGDTHLHFEMWREGRQVDPMPHLRGAAHDARQDAGTPARAAVDVLRKHDTGPAVRELQQQLNHLGYRGADGRLLETASGVFGPQTDHALRAFQADRGIEVDGAYGRQSREAMAAALRAAGDRARDTCTSPQQERGEGAQRSFVDRLFSAMHEGDDRAMRQALDDYLKTPGGQDWQRQEPPAEQAGQRDASQQRDLSGPAR